MKRTQKDSFNNGYLYLTLVLVFSIIFYRGYVTIETEKERTASAVRESFDEKIRNIQEGIVEVQFDFGNGYKRRFSGDISQGVMLDDVVDAAAKAGGIQVLWDRDRVYLSDKQLNIQKKPVAIYKDKQLVTGSFNLMPVAGGLEIELRVQ